MDEGYKEYLEEEKKRKWSENERRQSILSQIDVWGKHEPELSAIWNLSYPSFERHYENEFGIETVFLYEEYYSKWMQWCHVHQQNVEKYLHYFTPELLDRISEHIKVLSYAHLFLRHIIQGHKLSDYIPPIRDWLKEDSNREEYLLSKYYSDKRFDKAAIDSIIWDERFNEGTDLFYWKIEHPGKWNDMLVRYNELPDAWHLWRNEPVYKKFKSEHNSFWVEKYREQEEENKPLFYDDDLYEIQDWDELDSFGNPLPKASPSDAADKALFTLWTNECINEWNEWRNRYILERILRVDYPTFKLNDEEHHTTWAFFQIQDNKFRVYISNLWILAHQKEWDDFVKTIDIDGYKKDIALASSIDYLMDEVSPYSDIFVDDEDIECILSLGELMLRNHPEYESVCKKYQMMLYNEYVERNWVWKKDINNPALTSYFQMSYNIYIAEKYYLLPSGVTFKKIVDLY